MAKAKTEAKKPVVKAVKKEIKKLDEIGFGWTANDVRDAIIEVRQKVNELIEGQN